MIATLRVIILVLCPWLDAGHHPSPEEWAALKRLNVVCELAGPGEKYGEWRSEVSFTRRYLRELADAPPLADGLRLPPPVPFEQECALNGEYGYWLGRQVMLRPHQREALCEVRRANRKCSRFIQQLNQYHDNDHWYHRRQCLLEIRELLGRKDFDEGRWPNAVPLWAMEEVP